jgi:protein-S-isoprenylcysteine O-methyltransferase Ste14
VLIFLATTIIALGFVAVMVLLPKYKQRLVKRMLEYHVKERERVGRFYRVALLVIIIFALVFPVVSQYQLIASQYMSLFVLTFCIVNLVAGVIFVAGFLKARGKWGLLLIAALFASVLLGVLVGWMTKHG